MVDANQLENAVLNLCINARDAMLDGGRLQIETAHGWLDDRASEGRQQSSTGAYVLLGMTDTGSGMSPQVVAQAFEPFFTTKPLVMGAGLGLSIVYWLCPPVWWPRPDHLRTGPRHQGANRPSPTSWLRQRHRTADADRVHQPVKGEGKTALVIDDEPTVRIVVADLLAEARFSVLTAEDGVAGLAVLESALVVDLLVTDVGLPGGLNGRQVADVARVRRPDMKVLFITGSAEHAVVGSSGCLEPEMAILTKPLGVDALEAKIRVMLEA